MQKGELNTRKGWKRERASHALHFFPFQTLVTKPYMIFFPKTVATACSQSFSPFILLCVHSICSFFTVLCVISLLQVLGGPHCLTCVIMFFTVAPYRNTAPRKMGPFGPFISSNISANLVVSLTSNFDLAERFVKSFVLVKLCSEKPVFEYSLRTILGRIWNAQPGWSFKKLRLGVFVSRFESEADCQKILERRPWIINNSLLNLAT